METTMDHFLVRLFPSFLSVMLIWMVGNHAVQAQSSPLTEPSTRATPNPDQPSPTTPANETPTEQTQSRPLRNQIGIGGSLGVSGSNTGLSEGGFAILTKNDLNDFLSLRGTTVFGDTRTDNTLALTANIPIRFRSGDFQLVPFMGGGVLISSKSVFNDMIVRGLVTGGIDIPISQRFTFTTSVNVGFTEKTSVGVQLGIMYQF
jgi:hypothetical protein